MFVNMRFQASLLVLGLGVLLVSCSITRVKWRIKTDKDMASGRSAYLDSPIALANPERPPNIIVLLADDLGKYEVSAPSASTARRRPRLGPATTRFSSTWRTCSSVAR